MNRTSAFAVLVAAMVLIGGCAAQPIKIVSTQVQDQAPEPGDPIYVTLLPTMNDRERALYDPLRQELCRQGFNVVENHASSRWTLVLTHDREIFREGIDNFYHQSRSGAYRPDLSFAQLYLFPSDRYRDLREAPAWVGRLAATPRNFQRYEPVIFQRLLERFGDDTRAHYKLSRFYRWQVKREGQCVSAS